MIYSQNLGKRKTNEGYDRQLSVPLSLEYT